MPWFPCDFSCLFTLAWKWLSDHRSCLRCSALGSAEHKLPSPCPIHLVGGLPHSSRLPPTSGFFGPLMSSRQWSCTEWGFLCFSRSFPYCALDYQSDPGRWLVPVLTLQIKETEPGRDPGSSFKTHSMDCLGPGAQEGTEFFLSLDSSLPLVSAESSLCQRPFVSILLKE